MTNKPTINTPPQGRTVAVDVCRFLARLRARPATS